MNGHGSALSVTHKSQRRRGSRESAALYETGSVNGKQASIAEPNSPMKPGKGKLQTESQKALIHAKKMLEYYQSQV